MSQVHVVVGKESARYRTWEQAMNILSIITMPPVQKITLCVAVGIATILEGVEK